MRIGLSGATTSSERTIRQAVEAEADGFSSLWFGTGLGGDPLVAMALAGRATERIELGTAVLQTFPCHPLLQANRAAATVEAMGRPGLTLGIGPSHEQSVRSTYGLSYDHPGRNTEEYANILVRLLRGETVDLDGEDWTAHSAGRMASVPHPVPVLVAAMGPRLLRVAGAVADGTVLWLATPRAIEEHVAPRIRAAAAAAGRSEPRIVAGVPVAVHHDEGDARAAAATVAFADQPSYQRILERGGVNAGADAAIVGTERAVRQQLQGLIDAGATDVWASVFPVGPDRRASITQTMDLLRELVQ